LSARAAYKWQHLSECLRQLEPVYGPLRFRASCPLDPVILYDGGVVIGAIMPKMF
jgi:hypothetical protein